MVKNQTGGNKSKHLARKHLNGNGSGTKSDKRLRVSTCELEVYARVIKPFGNGMCLVKCIDGYTRLCHIRSKFSGRNKYENTINVGSWLLIGLREFENHAMIPAEGRIKSNGKREYQDCDLLEIYTSSEQKRLMEQEAVFQGMQENSDEDSGSDNDQNFRDNQNIHWVDEETMEYHNIMNNTGISKRKKGMSYEDLYNDITDSDDDEHKEDKDDDNKQMKQMLETAFVTSDLKAMALNESDDDDTSSNEYIYAGNSKTSAAASSEEEIDVNDI